VSDEPDFQAWATIQGKSVEQAAQTVLRIEGWHIIQTHAVIVGQEVDIVAADPGGVIWWIECKGSWRGKRPGLRRPDTLKKAIAVAWYLAVAAPDPAPYMVFTSHLPVPGSSGDAMLQAALVRGIIERVRTFG